MATSKMTKLVNTDAPKRRPTPQPLSESQLISFGNFGGSTDIKAKAAYLAKKGLVGAGDLYNAHPDLSKPGVIINTESHWKPSALSHMLIRARQLGLQTPTEIAANREALLGSLPPRLKDAMTNPVFNQVHPNWWDTFNSVLKDQYANEAASIALPSVATSLVKK